MDDDEKIATLADFGYAFNDRGELRNVKDGSKFIFEVKPGDHDFNQKHYEALGKVIDEAVYKMLEEQCNLKRMTIPVNDNDQFETREDLRASEIGAHGFFFVSDDFETNSDMLILIHGSGVVRAGQWSRRLIINDNVESGTQIPYIKRALKMGLSVVVLNTNQNRGLNINGDEVPIKGSETPNAHALYIWDTFVVQSHVRNVYIVAHSAGGPITGHLATKRQSEFQHLVRAVALTDSVRSLTNSQNITDQLIKISRNWVCSPQDPGTIIARSDKIIDVVSAGTTVHELSSHVAIDMVFDFIVEKFKLCR